MCNSRIIFAVGPLIAVPATIGETATIGTRRARKTFAHAGNREHRIDADERIRRTDDDAGEPRIVESLASISGDNVALGGAVESKSGHRRRAAIADEVVLEREFAVRRADHRAHRRVAHRQDLVC